MSSILSNIAKLRLKLDTILKYSVLVFFLVWPWQTRYFLVVGVNEYLTTSIYASDIVVLILLFVIASRSIAQAWQSQVDKNVGEKVMRFLDNLRLPRRVTPRNDKQNGVPLQQLLNYFFISLVPVAILAIAQFSLQISLSTKWLGLAQHDPAELGQVVIETAQGERWLRAYGSFDHPNILGGVMAVALMFLLVYKKERWGRIENLYTALFATALFFSFSRTAWLGLVVGLVVFVIASRRETEARQSLVGKSVGEIFKNFLRNLRLPRRFTPRNDSVKSRWKFFAIIFLIFTLLSLLYSNLLFARVSADGRIEQKSIAERVSYYSEAKALFLTHPYFGVGPGNYVSALMEMKPGQPAWSYQPVHNTFALILVELGLIGTGLLGLLLAVLARRYLKLRDAIARPGVLPVLAGITAMMLLDHWWWSLHAGWLLIGIVAVISVKLSQD